MHIWLVKLEEPLPIDSDYRPYRMGMLADALLNRGHTVTRWASDYNHVTHKYRLGKRASVKIADRYSAELLNSGITYSNALSPKRVVDNFLLYRQFKKAALKMSAPDVIVSSMPTPEMASASAEIARFYKIPFVLDARDMWPDVIESELKGVKAILAKPIISRMRHHLKFASKNASSLVGITEFYRDHLLKYAGREVSRSDRVFPLGFDSAAGSFQESEEEELHAFWASKGVNLNEMDIVYFAGRLNSTVFHPIDVVIDAAKALITIKPTVRVILCGSGAYEFAIKQKASFVSNVIFPGEISAKALSKLRKHSIAALLPVERRVDYQNSLSNKFFEYLSSGMPVLSWLDGLPGKTLEQSHCGFIYNSTNQLIDYIVKLVESPYERDAMSSNATQLFNREYSAHIVYDKFAQHIEKLVNK